MDITVKGKIVKGKHIGHELGFPTANVDISNQELPLNGVYCVDIIIDKKKYLGMANIGHNPTISSLNPKTLEVYIFDFDKDIYGYDVTVIFNYFVRHEKKFSSKTELIEQLNKDKEYILKNGDSI